MSTTNGNTRLRGARQAAGYRSQTTFADALTDVGKTIGLRLDVTSRTVRRWESETPPWPSPEHEAAIEALLKQPLAELGFTPPWEADDRAGHKKSAASQAARRAYPTIGAGTLLPTTVAADYAVVTSAHRRLYWSIPAAKLHGPVAGHARLGAELVSQIPSPARASFAAAVAESALLAARLEFFDLHYKDAAQQSLVLSLQAAHEAGDSLLGAAALAHMAFAPAFSGDQGRAEEARERVRAARAFARRGEASAVMLAWLDAVEAEVETRFGNTRQALSLVHHGEEIMRKPEQKPTPSWLDWFSETRLAGFKGNTQMEAGQASAARETLEGVLRDLPEQEIKQRSVILADLAAVAVLEKDPDRACTLASEVLNQLGHIWYATAMDRIRVVRQSLHKWESAPCVRQLDERLYDWHTTVNGLAGDNQLR